MSCQQRKVKCDRGQPTCFNCARHRTNCVYSTPARPQRRKRKASEEELVHRLRRCEALLKAYGVNPDEFDRVSAARGNNGGLEAPHSSKAPEQLSSPKRETDDGYPSPKPAGKFVADGGKQSFIENHVWTCLSDELQGPLDLQRLSQSRGTDNHHLAIGAPRESVLSTGELVLDSVSVPSTVDLKALHPEPLMIFRLWQIFLDNVNPLTKLIHAPTTQHGLLDASARLEKISSEWEALMFTIYLSAVQSMSADECQSTMGESKSTLFRRYHSAVKSALLKANYTNTQDILIVQAFTLYIFAIRPYHEPNSLWILTGTAVRLGQRIGLHRDGTLIGLSPFDTEIRRRIWWRLISLDCQSAELCGAGLSVTSPRYDSKMPLNVNDSDLSPDMSALPSEHEGPTEMIFCGFRYEIGLFLRKAKNDSKLIGIGRNNIPVGDGTDSLDDLQAVLEHKYLRFCDLSVPLHLFTQITGGTVVMALRLLARHPRKYSQGITEMPSNDREEVFWISIRLLDYYLTSLRTKIIQKFLWEVNVLQFHWHALVILAQELQLRPGGKGVCEAWSKIEELFEYNPDVIDNINMPLHKAVSSLILQAWSARQSHLRDSNLQVPTPGFLVTLQNQAAKQGAAKPSKAPFAQPEPMASGDLPAFPTAMNGSTIDATGFQANFKPDMFADGDPIDWSEWDHMLQDFEFQSTWLGQT